MRGNRLGLLLSLDNLRPDAGGDVGFDLTARNQLGIPTSSDINLIADAAVKVELSKGLKFNEGWDPPDTFVKSGSQSAIWSPPDTDTKFSDKTNPESREIEIQAQLTSDTLDKIPLEERCITARVTDSIPPPSADYALGSLTECLGDDPPVLLEEGSVAILTSFPCINDSHTDAHQCESVPGVAVAARLPSRHGDYVESDDFYANLRSHDVGRTDETTGSRNRHLTVFLDPESVFIQVKDPEGRVRDSHTQSVSDVSWQTARKAISGKNRAVDGVTITYTRKDIKDASAWKSMGPRTLTVTREDGATPGKVKIRFISNGNTFFDFSSTNTVTKGAFNITTVDPQEFPYFAEFETLGTYLIKYDLTLTDSSSNPYTDSGTYTFHVGPVADLEVRDGGPGSLPPGQRAVSIMAVNHGPDAAPAARVTVPDLPENATVNYTASRGSFDFDSDAADGAGAWVWDIGELLSRDTNQARTGRDGETLTIATGAASQVTAAIENTQDYQVCINSSAADVDADNQEDCKTESGNTNAWHAAVCVDTAANEIDTSITVEGTCDGTTDREWTENVCASSAGGVLAARTEAVCFGWHSTVYYDYDDGNDEAVIRKVSGSGEARLSAAQVRRDQRVTSVSWPDISTFNQRPVTHYEVARSTDGGLNWRLLSDRWPISTFFDQGAGAGPSVRYRVRTVNDQGHKGQWSAAVGSGQSAKTPAQPQNVIAATAATEGASTITLSWEEPASDGGSPITGYQVQASATGEGGWGNACGTSDAAELTCDHTGLNVGTTRHYRVAARNANGLGPWSDPPAAGSTEVGVPDAPRSLRIQTIQAASGEAVHLTWTAPARDNGSPIQGYEVEGSFDGSDWSTLGKTDSKSARDLLDIGSILWFNPGQTRHYRVRASNTIGDGQWSSAVRVTTAAARPEGMSAWAEPNGQNAIDIFWGEPHLKGAATIASYELQVCVPPKECAANNDSDYSRVTSPSGTTLSYTHTGLQPGDERYYRVRARNSAGWSEWSWPTSATTLDLDLGPDTGLPGAPRLTARANGSSEIKLSWTEADARGSEIDTYELEFSGDGLYWDRLAYNWPGDTEYIHEGLDGGTRNYYRIRALILHEGRHIGGQWSTVVNATTVAGAPAEPLLLIGEGVAQESDDSKHDHVALTLKIRADSTITRYQVERSVDGGNSAWKQVSVSKSALVTEDCTIDGTQTKCETVTLKDNARDLFPGTYYYYRVAAVNSKGMGPYAYGDALTAGDWVHAPSRPRLLSLSNVSRNAATVTWIEPEDDGGVAVTGYEYQYLSICGEGETENCGDWPQDADGFDIVTKTTSKSVRLSGLGAGGGYHFRVRAVNLAEEITGKGDWSHDVYIETPDS
ncbi:MAG: fibronectin type III domain-containing protein [Chloroflexi bacterium]|nr:fibronectin type III domain-containing protein [Chloroflexota bacterium]